MSWRSEIVAEMHELRVKAKAEEAKANEALHTAQSEPSMAANSLRVYLAHRKEADSAWQSIGILESML